MASASIAATIACEQLAKLGPRGTATDRDARPPGDTIRAMIALAPSVAYRIGSFRFGGTTIVLATMIALTAVAVVLWGFWLSRKPWR